MCKVRTVLRREAAGEAMKIFALRGCIFRRGLESQQGLQGTGFAFLSPGHGAGFCEDKYEPGEVESPSRAG